MVRLKILALFSIACILNVSCEDLEDLKRISLFRARHSTYKFNHPPFGESDDSQEGSVYKKVLDSENRVQKLSNFVAYSESQTRSNENNYVNFDYEENKKSDISNIEETAINSFETEITTTKTPTEVTVASKYVTPTYKKRIYKGSRYTYSYQPRPTIAVKYNEDPEYVAPIIKPRTFKYFRPQKATLRKYIVLSNENTERNGNSPSNYLRSSSYSSSPPVERGEIQSTSKPILLRRLKLRRYNKRPIGYIERQNFDSNSGEASDGSDESYVDKNDFTLGSKSSTFASKSALSISETSAISGNEKQRKVTTIPSGLTSQTLVYNRPKMFYRRLNNTKESSTNGDIHKLKAGNFRGKNKYLNISSEPLLQAGKNFTRPFVIMPRIRYSFQKDNLEDNNEENSHLEDFVQLSKSNIINKTILKSTGKAKTNQENYESQTIIGYSEKPRIKLPIRKYNNIRQTKTLKKYPTTNIKTELNNFKLEGQEIQEYEENNETMTFNSSMKSEFKVKRKHDFQNSDSFTVSSDTVSLKNHIQDLQQIDSESLSTASKNNKGFTSAEKNNVDIISKNSKEQEIQQLNSKTSSGFAQEEQNFTKASNTDFEQFLVNRNEALTSRVNDTSVKSAKNYSQATVVQENNENIQPIVIKTTRKRKRKFSGKRRSNTTRPFSVLNKSIKTTENELKTSNENHATMISSDNTENNENLKSVFSKYSLQSNSQSSAKTYNNHKQTSSESTQQEEEDYRLKSSEQSYIDESTIMNLKNNKFNDNSYTSSMRVPYRKYDRFYDKSQITNENQRNKFSTGKSNSHETTSTLSKRRKNEDRRKTDSAVLTEIKRKGLSEYASQETSESSGMSHTNHAKTSLASTQQEFEEKDYQSKSSTQTSVDKSTIMHLGSNKFIHNSDTSSTHALSGNSDKIYDESVIAFVNQKNKFSTGKTNNHEIISTFGGLRENEERRKTDTAVLTEINDKGLSEYLSQETSESSGMSHTNHAQTSSASTQQEFEEKDYRSKSSVQTSVDKPMIMHLGSNKFIHNSDTSSTHALSGNSDTIYDESVIAFVNQKNKFSTGKTNNHEIISTFSGRRENEEGRETDSAVLTEINGKGLSEYSSHETSESSNMSHTNHAQTSSASTQQEFEEKDYRSKSSVQTSVEKPMVMHLGSNKFIHESDTSSTHALSGKNDKIYDKSFIAIANQENKFSTGKSNNHKTISTFGGRRENEERRKTDTAVLTEINEKGLSEYSSPETNKSNGMSHTNHAQTSSESTQQEFKEKDNQSKSSTQTSVDKSTIMQLGSNKFIHNSDTSSTHASSGNSVKIYDESVIAIANRENNFSTGNIQSHETPSEFSGQQENEERREIDTSILTEKNGKRISEYSSQETGKSNGMTHIDHAQTFSASTQRELGEKKYRSKSSVQSSADKSTIMHLGSNKFLHESDTSSMHASSGKNDKIYDKSFIAIANQENKFSTGKSNNHKTISTFGGRRENEERRKTDTAVLTEINEKGLSEYSSQETSESSGMSHTNHAQTSSKSTPQEFKEKDNRSKSSTQTSVDKSMIMHLGSNKFIHNSDTSSTHASSGNSVKIYDESVIAIANRENNFSTGKIQSHETPSEFSGQQENEERREIDTSILTETNGKRISEYSSQETGESNGMTHIDHAQTFSASTQRELGEKKYRSKSSVPSSADKSTIMHLGSNKFLHESDTSSMHASSGKNDKIYDKSFIAIANQENKFSTGKSNNHKTISTFGGRRESEERRKTDTAVLTEINDKGLSEYLSQETSESSGMSHTNHAQTSSESTQQEFKEKDYRSKSSTQTSVDKSTIMHLGSNKFIHNSDTSSAHASSDENDIVMKTQENKFFDGKSKNLKTTSTLSEQWQNERGIKGDSSVLTEINKEKPKTVPTVKSTQTSTPNSDIAIETLLYKSNGYADASITNNDQQKMYNSKFVIGTSADQTVTKQLNRAVTTIGNNNQPIDFKKEIIETIDKPFTLVRQNVLKTGRKTHNQEEKSNKYQKNTEKSKETSKRLFNTHNYPSESISSVLNRNVFKSTSNHAESVVAKHEVTTKVDSNEERKLTRSRGHQKFKTTSQIEAENNNQFHSDAKYSSDSSQLAKASMGHLTKIKNEAFDIRVEQRKKIESNSVLKIKNDSKTSRSRHTSERIDRNIKNAVMNTKIETNKKESVDIKNQYNNNVDISSLLEKMSKNKAAQSRQTSVAAQVSSRSKDDSFNTLAKDIEFETKNLHTVGKEIYRNSDTEHSLSQHLDNTIKNVTEDTNTQTINFRSPQTMGKTVVSATTVQSIHGKQDTVKSDNAKQWSSDSSASASLTSLNHKISTYLSSNRKHGEPQPVVKIVEMENKLYSQNGEFIYGYRTDDGTRAYHTGILKEVTEDHAGEAVSGEFSYTDRDGNDFSISYTADENGYRPVGAHLPTPPPIPPAIARALAYLATKTTPEPVTESIKRH